MKSKNQPSITKDLILYSIIFLLVVWLFFTYRILLGPLIIAGLTAYILYPGVNWLAKRLNTDRRRVVPLVYITFLCLLILAVIYLIPQLTLQASILSQELSNLPVQLKNSQLEINKFLGFNLPIDKMVEEFDADISQFVKPDKLFRVIQGASTNIILLLIILISSYHLLRDWDQLREWLFSLAPGDLNLDLRLLHKEIKVVWQTYFRGQLLIMFILGILSGIGAALMGIPGALILGFLAGALALIPGIGPAIATSIAAIVAWTQGSYYWDLSNIVLTMLVIAVFTGIQAIEGFWLTPRVMSYRLKLHPGLVLIAIVGTLITLGALMALIVIPIIGSIELIIRFIRNKSAGIDPWPIDNTNEIYPEVG
jgi:predicted PurR-regulated permease PerM